MLMLLFCVENDVYALDCEHIIEVIPRVKLKKIPHVPEYISGLLNFRGQPVPVIDICQMIQGRPSAFRLHTRIILLRYENHLGEARCLGMIAEKVTDSIDREKSDFIESGMKVKELPFIGGTLHLEEDVIQYFRVDELFNSMQQILFDKKRLS